jgi:hypothetical protein
MYLRRAAEQLLKDILAGDKVGVIVGARQVGKTTLVQHVLAGLPAVFLNEVKWSPRRGSARAFRDAYGVEVEPIRPDSPFATNIFKT